MRVALFVAVGAQALFFTAYYRITDGCFCSASPPGQTFSRADLFITDLLTYQAEMTPFGRKYLPDWALDSLPFLAWDGLTPLFGAGLAMWFLGLLAMLDLVTWMRGPSRNSVARADEATRLAR